MSLKCVLSGSTQIGYNDPSNKAFIVVGRCFSFFWVLSFYCFLWDFLFVCFLLKTVRNSFIRKGKLKMTR